eukprot:3342463-Alexandrium_andersonii.AAC.1
MAAGRCGCWTEGHAQFTCRLPLPRSGALLRLFQSADTGRRALCRLRRLVCIQTAAHAAWGA